MNDNAIVVLGIVAVVGIVFGTPMWFKYHKDGAEGGIGDEPNKKKK